MASILVILGASALMGFVSPAFQAGTGYYVIHRYGVYWHNDGTFSTDNMIQSIGTSNKLRLAYSAGMYTDIVANDEGEIYIGKVIDNPSENESLLVLETSWQNVDEARQGVLNLYCGRDTAITSWGGSPDMAIKVSIRNNVESGVGVGHMRGMEIVASNRGTTGDVVSAYFSAESRSGKESSSIKSLWLIYDQSGNVNTDHMGLFIQCNSQSNTGTNYGINLTTTSYNQTREYAMFIDSNAGSWTNGISFNGTMTNVFDFEGTAGTSGAGYNASFTNPAAFAVPDGYIKVDIGGNTQYIYTYTTIPST